MTGPARSGILIRMSLALLSLVVLMAADPLLQPLPAETEVSFNLLDLVSP